MKRILVILLSLSCLFAGQIQAQTEGVSINATGDAPDPSAMLEVRSTDKGFLTPRMTSSERNAIPNPASGLIVYDLTTQSFWYYDNGQWNEIRNGNQILTYEDLIDSTLACHTEVSSVGPFSNPRDIAFRGDYAYVLSRNSKRVDAIDISNPLSSSKIGGIQLPASMWSPVSIAVYQNYLYVGDVNNGSSQRLAVYDISDPTTPIFSSFVSAVNTFNFYDLRIKENLLVGAASSGEGLVILSLADPANPALLGSTPSSSGVLFKIRINGDYAFGINSTYDELEVFDISNPSSPQHISSTPIGGITKDLTIIGSFVYVSDNGNNMLRSYNVADPANPQQADSLALPNNNTGLASFGNKIYLLQGQLPIMVVDVSEPGLPLLDGSITLNGSSGPKDFQFYGEFGYICDGSAVANKVRVIKACLPKRILLDPETGEFSATALEKDDQNLSLDAYALGIEDGTGVDLLPLFDRLIDEDQDTEIELTETVDGDQISFTAEGAESFRVNKAGIFSGTSSVDGTGETIFTGAGARFIWLPRRGVFRVGETLGAEWDDGNLPFNSSVLGGQGNGISGSGALSTIGGGKENDITGGRSFIGGGEKNEVTDSHSTLGGGLQNVVSGKFGFVGGGRGSQATGDYASVAGGRSNLAAGTYSLAGGFANSASSYGETVFGFFSEIYTPVSATSFNPNDRLFVIGNGMGAGNLSNALTILKNGFTGLGTSSPDTTLHLVGKFKYQDGAQSAGQVLTSDANGVASWQAPVIGNPDNLGDHTATQNITLGSYFLSGDGDDEGVFVDVTGNIGIGTSNPTRAKVEIVGSVDHQLGTYGFLNPDGNTGTFPPVSPSPYSLYASNRIAASHFNAHSDIRIKKVQGISNSEADLASLMQIEITNYSMRDTISHGPILNKKVIAQQVAEVYPQAVTTNLTEVIPDIYQRAEVQDGWIMLATDLKIGERVKLITEEGAKVYGVSKVEADRFQVSGLLVSPPASRSKAVPPLFVYGREVDDFHTVDYEAISMLNVSATQAQQKLIEKLQLEIERLGQLTEDLVTQHQNLKADIRILEARRLDDRKAMESLEVRLQQLEEIQPKEQGKSNM